MALNCVHAWSKVSTEIVRPSRYFVEEFSIAGPSILFAIACSMAQIAVWGVRTHAYLDTIHSRDESHESGFHVSSDPYKFTHCNPILHTTARIHQHFVDALDSRIVSNPRRAEYVDVGLSGTHVFKDRGRG